MPHRASLNLRSCAAGVVSALALTAMCGATASAASSPRASSPRSRTRVPQGINPTRIQGARQDGATPGSTTMTVSFILKAQNLSSLESQVEAGWKGPYLTTAQFAKQYGQTPQVVSELESYLGSYGITSTADADDLDVTAQGTAAEFNQALTIFLENYTIPAKGAGRTQKIYASAGDPTVPAGLASDILSILGLSNYAPFASGSVKAVATPERTGAATNGIPFGERTPQDFESEYGLDGLEADGAAGQGQTIGIVTLASVDPTVPQTFWNMLGLDTKANRITLDDVDGGSGPVSLANGSDETTLDVEQSGAIAPQANIDVYQAPNTDYGFVDAFYTAASQNVADSVSTSWIESETYIAAAVASGLESPTYAESFDEAFLEMAAQGQSSFSCAGDWGAYSDTVDLGTTALSVMSPSDSPYTTSAGGTTNAGTQTYPFKNAGGKDVVGQVDIPEQITWNWGYLWPLYRVFGEPSLKSTAVNYGFDWGSTGGYSTIDPRPTYQNGVSGVASYSDYPYLTPTHVEQVEGITVPTKFSFTPYPTLGAGTATSGRAVPDLSLDADPQTGYALYDPQFEKLYGTDIELYGGTSFVAPQLNGVDAVYESALGHRVGFWNPVIYAAAQAPGSPFTPIDADQQYSGSEYLSQTNLATGVTKALPGSFANDNLYYTGTPGTVYNPGSGLGYPDLGALESDFATH